MKNIGILLFSILLIIALAMPAFAHDGEKYHVHRALDETDYSTSGKSSNEKTPDPVSQSTTNSTESKNSSASAQGETRTSVGYISIDFPKPVKKEKK